MINLRSLVFALLLFAGVNASAVPSWVKVEKSQERIGNIYRVICNASGPSLQVARREALESCQSSASDQLVTSLQINSKTVESESDVVLHHVVSSDRVIKNLNCMPKNESIENDGTSTTVWLFCEFDLNKAKVNLSPNAASSESPPKKILRRISSEDSKPEVVSVNYRIAISSVPACESILIGTTDVKIVRCSTNPMIVSLEPDDTKLVIRAKGYMPQEISIDDGIRKRGSVEVFLDAN